MKRLAIRAMTVLASVVALYLLVDTISMVGSYLAAEQGVRVSVQPYTVTLQETVTRAEGAGTVKGATETWALRSDGARMYRREVVGRNGMAVVGRSIYLPSGVTFEIDDVRELVTTGVGGEQNLASVLRDPASGCRDSYLGRPYRAGQTSIGSQQMAEYLAFGFSLGSATLWFAPAAGCALIGQRGLESTDGFRSDKKLVSIKVGEPSVSLFAVSERHREVAPSIVFGYSSADPIGHRMDERYHQNLQSAPGR